jgi:pimeloyl-ACP methyl ester carboxylesterase
MRAGTDRFVVGVTGGRSVEVLTAGPPDGLPLVFHTGTPGGLAGFAPLIEAASARNLRTICYSRPGYGRSDPQPGRRVADAAADVASVLDRLGATSFVTAGWSGGGPHALATAALLADRCLAAATIAGVAPYPASGLDWLAGMAAENVAEFGAAMDSEQVLTAALEAEAAKLADITAERVAEALGGLASAVDLAVITGEFAQYLAESDRTAVSSGIAGWRDDDLAFVRDWGFSLDQVRVPLSIWQGDRDAMVPFGHGEWLAGQLPHARAHLLSGEGHLTLVQARIDDIFGELAQQAGRG